MQAISASGTYEIIYSSESFGKTADHSAPNLVVRAYNNENVIIAEKNVSVPSQDETVNLMTGESSDEWRICGIVSLGTTPLISGRVQLFDNFEGNEYLLGSATLNECGYYQITYQKSRCTI